MSGIDILLIIIIVFGIIFGALYFLNKWAYKKMDSQQSLIEKAKMPATIFVIDKKKSKLQNANLPKAVMDNVPKFYRMFKMPIIKAKVGNKITTLMCDKKIFDALPLKKNVKVELAGIYIVKMQGYKNPKELKKKSFLPWKKQK